MNLFDTKERTMIDIHMHLIPGVDDGAEDMMMSRVMLLLAREQGICGIFATPHSEAFNYSPEGARIIFQRLMNQVGSKYPDVKIAMGCEVYCEARNMQAVLEGLDSGRYPTMNENVQDVLEKLGSGQPPEKKETAYVLIEFSMWTTEEDALICVQKLVQGGYQPIVAHMERYRNLRGNMALMNRFRELGALIQVNAYSLFDEGEDSIRNWARQLVLEQKADFLGTDAHRSYHRPPSAQMGLQWLYENVSKEYADALAWGNAEKLLMC